MSVVVSTENLSKAYKAGFWKTKTISALDRLNLEVRENEIFGYLGPNGAGKSTTLKLLMSLIHPSSGKAEILGKPVADLSIRRHIGYLPENPYFYEYLSAEEFLSYYASLFDFSLAEIRTKVEYFLKLTDISHARKLQLHKFSKGMLQRVGIAQALINDPKIVFLDEPMSGLDPIGRREVRDLILLLKKEGKTVFFSTHILNDVEVLCDKVAVLNRGKLIGSGHLTDLISQEVSHIEIVVSNINFETVSQAVGSSAKISHSGMTLRLELRADTPLAPLVTRIENAAGKVLAINPVRQTMEDYFFKLINRDAIPEGKPSIVSTNNS
ncbi:MAG: ABC transporter [Acidobacteria bacterium]|nr:MAG: ABC transporter [Acidobacteriota bacterium]